MGILKPYKVNMATLSNEEKQELLALSRSSQLRKDMQILKENLNNQTVTIDEYIEFLDEMNALNEHRLKEFRPITGDMFLL